MVRRQKAIAEKEELTREKAKAADERKRKALANKKVKEVPLERTDVLAAPIVRFGDKLLGVRRGWFCMGTEKREALAKKFRGTSMVHPALKLHLLFVSGTTCLEFG